ncbi:hypothetical protein AHAS_Ahas17G0080900 [Arachis hypogaea]
MPSTTTVGGPARSPTGLGLAITMFISVQLMKRSLILLIRLGFIMSGLTATGFSPKESNHSHSHCRISNNS